MLEKKNEWKKNVANALLVAIVLMSVFYLFYLKEETTKCITDPLHYIESKYNVTTQILTGNQIMIYPNNEEDENYNELKIQWDNLI